MSQFDIISKSEAKARGLKRYFIPGRPCMHGHVSPRYVNGGACCACTTVKGIANGAKISVARAKERKPLPPEPPLIARRQELLTNGALPVGPFAWTPENKAALIDAYIDTGDIAFARDAIGVRPSEYRRELERNADFAQAVADAEPKAQKHLEERAIQLALRGNDKLLIAVLKARLPEYRDSLKIESTQVVKLSDDELNRRIRRLSGGTIIDARFTEVEPQAKIGVIQPAEGTEAAGESEQDIDVLLR